MRTKTEKQGFTLVELMVSMIAFTLLALIAGTILVFAWNGWRDSIETVGMQRDAMIAMRIMEKEIRNSNINEVSGDSTGLSCANGTTRTNAFRFSAASIPYNSGVLLDSWSAPTIGTNTVTVSFVLRTSRAGYGNAYTKTIYPRNKP